MSTNPAAATSSERPLRDSEDGGHRECRRNRTTQSCMNCPDVISLSQHYAQIAQALQSFMPSACRFLSSGDVKPIGSHPMAAGGFTDIWEATHGGRKVVLKSYRCYVAFDLVQVVEVHYDHNLRRAVH